MKGDVAANEILAFSVACREAAHLSQRDRPPSACCELCAEIGNVGQTILDRAFEYRGVVLNALVDDSDDEKDDDEEDGEDEAGDVTHKIPPRRGTCC